MNPNKSSLVNPTFKKMLSRKKQTVLIKGFPNSLFWKLVFDTEVEVILWGEDEINTFFVSS